MGYWEKIPDRPKSQKFRCSKCGKTCTCVKYEGHRTVCDYKYCPYCREPMESEGVGMTREKAIEVLNTYDMSEDNEDTEFKDALALAIKVLEQEPCEDAVSRVNLLKMYEDRFIELQKAHRADTQSGVNWCINTLKDMPPVATTRKWIPCSERLPKAYEFVNCTCHSLIDDREDWVIETVYIPQLSCSPYSDWGNIPMLNVGKCEVIAWMHRDIPKPYKAEMESEK